MFQTARLVGDTVKEVIHGDEPEGQKAEGNFNASFILGGQIRGTEPRLFQIYPEGNFIESSSDTPFFQIGEHKYGKPILVRAYDASMSFAEAAKLLFVSFDSTLKSTCPSACRSICNSMRRTACRSACSAASTAMILITGSSRTAGRTR